MIKGLEENPKIKKAMQSLFVSISQVLPFMKITDNTDFYNSEKVRAYLKTKQGIYFKELDDSREDKFIRYAHYPGCFRNENDRFSIEAGAVFRFT